MEKEKIVQIIDDLLQDCCNDLEEIEEKKAKLIFDNVNLFASKLKDKIENENILIVDHRTNAEKWQDIIKKINILKNGGFKNEK